MIQLDLARIHGVATPEEFRAVVLGATSRDGGKSANIVESQKYQLIMTIDLYGDDLDQ